MKEPPTEKMPHEPAERTSAPSPVASEQEHKRAKRVRQPTTTILGYFDERRLRASRFLRDLREANVWDFSEEDVSDAVGRHRELDPHFSKTATLLSEAMKGKDRRHVRPAADFARGVLLDRLRDYPRWIGKSWDGGSAADRALNVASAVGSKMGDRKKGREAQNILAASLLLLGCEADLRYEDAVRATIRALDAQAEATPRWNDERLAYFARPRSSLAELRTVVQLITPWVVRGDDAEQRLATAEDRLESERRRVAASAADLNRRDEKIIALEAELNRQSERIHELEDELRSSVVHGTHDLDTTRSTIRAFLTGRLSTLLVTASEALEIDPPRTHVAKEKLDVAREAIEEQVKWLKP